MKKKLLYCLLTNDVETTSIINHTLSDDTGYLVLKEGMPALINLYKKYNIHSTFFYTGYIAEKFPEVVTMALGYGHEIASHGYTHKPDQSFDTLELNEQIDHLLKSKTILERLSSQEVVSFRAPACRVNKDTPLALKNTGFKIDSSVSPQRLDMIFSLGSLKKINWLLAPRHPGFTKTDNLWRSGTGKIFEIPICALGIPYISTTLRIIPLITKIIRYLLYIESRIFNKPILFLIHPNELFLEDRNPNITKRRTKGFLGYIFKDLITHRVKQKNLGSRAILLYENEIKFFIKRGFKFVTLNEYYNLIVQQTKKK